MGNALRSTFDGILRGVRKPEPDGNASGVSRQTTSAAVEPSNPQAIASGASAEQLLNCPNAKPLLSDGGDDPLVRRRLEKRGGAIAPEDVQGQQPAAEKSLLPPDVTLDLLAAEYSKSQRLTTHRALLLGCLTEKWIAEQLAMKTALDRATAMKKIRAELAAARIEPKEARVDLYVRCYHVARTFSSWHPERQASRAEANSMAFSVLRLFPLFLSYDKSAARWRVTESLLAHALWRRAVAEKLSAAVVDAEISKILPDRKPAGRAAAFRLPKLLKALPDLSIIELHTLIAQAQEQCRRREVPAAA